MGRAPCCDKASVKKGPWSPEEDAKLKNFIEKFGTGGNWIALPQKAGLKRCGKSCRLRWLNYLRPNIKHGEFTEEEDRIICSLYATIGSRWSIIAAQLPGRTDNDIKNYWNTKLKKKLLGSAPNHGKRNQLQYQQLHQQQQQELHFPNSLQLPQLSRALDHFNNPVVSNSSLLQSPSYFDYEAKPSIDDGRMNMIVFGNNDQSCTTSDHNNNMPPLESYLYNNNSGTGDHHQSHNLSTGVSTWGTDQAPLEYNYEEIKQLLHCSNNYTTLCCNTTSSISTSASCTPTSSSCVILSDDIPAVEGLKLIKPELGKMYQF